MPPHPCYSMTELAELTDTPKRRIKFYREQGLLSPPLPRKGDFVFAGVYKAWGPLHVRELRTIRDIKDTNRTLEDIRDYLHPEADHDLGDVSLPGDPDGDRPLRDLGLRGTTPAPVSRR